MNLVVVFDTDDYAGNFERQMCAFLTGRVGECEVGQEIAELVAPTLRHSAWYEEHVVEEPDDHGVWRPATAWPSPDGEFNSVAIFVDELPAGEVLSEMVERAQEFCGPPHNSVLGLSLIKPTRLLGLRTFRPSYRLDQVGTLDEAALAALLEPGN